MRCALCNRPMFGAGLQIGQLVVGPKCARKLKPILPKSRRIAVFAGTGQRRKATDSQLDLFSAAPNHAHRECA